MAGKVEITVKLSDGFTSSVNIQNFELNGEWGTDIAHVKRHIFDTMAELAFHCAGGNFEKEPE